MSFLLILDGTAGPVTGSFTAAAVILRTEPGSFTADAVLYHTILPAGVTGWAQKTNGQTVVIPGGASAGDRMFLYASWKDYSVTLDVSGWTQVVEYANGTVSQSGDNGSMKVAVWYKDHSGSESDPTLTFTGTPNIAGASMVAFRKPMASNWDTPVSATGPVTSAASWTATATLPVDIPTHDFSRSVVLGLVGFPDNQTNITRSSTAISGNDVTWFGNYVEYPETHFDTSVANDMAADAGYRLVQTGASNVTLTASGTLGLAENNASFAWVVQSTTGLMGLSGFRADAVIKRLDVSGSFTADAYFDKSPAFRSKETVATGATTVSSVDIPKPSGLATGDALLVRLTAQGTNQTITTPAGFSLVRADERTTGGTWSGIWVKYITDGGSEPSSYTFSWSTPIRVLATAIAYTEVSQVYPIDTSDWAEASNVNVTAPSVNVAHGRTLVTFHNIRSQRTFSVPTGMTQRDYAMTGTTGSDSDTSALVSDEVVSFNAATGTRLATASGGGADSSWVAQSVVLNRSSVSGASFTANAVIKRTQEEILPEVVGVASNGTSSTTSATYDITYPVGDVGDLLLAQFRHNGNDATITWPAGYTVLVTTTSAPDSAANLELYEIAYAFADNASAITHTVSASPTHKGVWTTSRIRFGGAPYVSTSATGTDNADTPSLTAPRAGKYLWYSFWGDSTENSTITYPTDYSLARIVGRGGGAGSAGDNPRIVQAARSLEATTEDPPAFTSTGIWWGWTVAVPSFWVTSFTADAVLAEPANTIEDDFTADAVILKTASAAFTADSVILRTESSTFTADAIVLRTEAASFTANAVIFRTEAGSFTANAVLLTTVSATFTADAVLEEGLVVVSDDFTADAVLLDTLEDDFTADAILVSTLSGSFTADSYLLAVGSGTFTANAILQRLGEAGSFTANAVLTLTTSGTFTANSVILVIQAASFTADAVLKRTVESSWAADAFLVSLVSGTFTADGVIKRESSSTFAADAVIRSEQVGSATANAIIGREESGAFTADAVLLVIASDSFTADAVITDTFAFEFTADAVITLTTAGDFTADALLVRIEESDFTADAVLLVESTSNFTADAHLYRVADRVRNAIIRTAGRGNSLRPFSTSRIRMPRRRF